jgi:hypothetical protein
MSQSATDETPMAATRKTRIFPSDDLKSFLGLLEHFPALRPLVGEVIQFMVVLDASSVQGELRWRVRSRRDPSARSSLHELVESGVVIAVAPPWIKIEIEKYIPLMATEMGVPVATVLHEWTRFETMIRYFRPRTDIATKVPCDDAKDLPYIQTYDQIGADFIWTRDSHFIETNPPDMAEGLDNSLRDYARATSILVGVKVGSGFAVLCGIEIIAALCKAGIEGIRKIPPTLRVSIGLAIAGLLLHPKSRERLLALLKQGLAFLGRAKPMVASISQDALKNIGSAAQTAKTAEQAIRAAIPAVAKPRMPALIMVRAVCLKAGEPLPLSEIEKRVRSAGHPTRARDFKAYLKVILQRNEEFIEISSGLWTLRTSSSGSSLSRQGTPVRVEDLVSHAN